jgi:4,5-dihydroxyphthalate decarboxylase
MARNLVLACEESKNRAVDRFLEMSVSRYCLPWAVDHAEQMKQKFGGDFFPFGIEPNLKTLSAFCQYAHEQGITRRAMKPEELFPEGLDLSVLI